MSKRIEEIEARLNASTPGPGFVGHCPVDNESIPKIEAAFNSALHKSIAYDDSQEFYWIETDDKLVVAYFGNGPSSEANASLWANARKDLPHLIEEIEKRDRAMRDLLKCIPNLTTHNKAPESHHKAYKAVLAFAYGES